jgi:hypothetical protein
MIQRLPGQNMIHTPFKIKAKLIHFCDTRFWLKNFNEYSLFT